MDSTDLTTADYQFIEAVKFKVHGWLQPVPFFIFSPSSIHEKNRTVVIDFVSRMLADETFKAALAKDGMPPQKLELILKSVSTHELWKRCWMMRCQWILQVLTLAVLWNIIWTIFT